MGGEQRKDFSRPGVKIRKISDIFLKMIQLNILEKRYLGIFLKLNRIEPPLLPIVSAIHIKNTNNILPIYAKMCLNFII